MSSLTQQRWEDVVLRSEMISVRVESQVHPTHSSQPRRWWWLWRGSTASCSTGVRPEMIRLYWHHLCSDKSVHTVFWLHNCFKSLKKIFPLQAFDKEIKRDDSFSLDFQKYNLLLVKSICYPMGNSTFYECPSDIVCGDTSVWVCFVHQI